MLSKIAREILEWRIDKRSSQIQSPLISKMLVQMETQARYKLEDQHQQPVERVAEGKIG